MSLVWVDVDDGLLAAVEARTDGFEERDEWIEEAVQEYVREGRVDARPELGKQGFREHVVEEAIRSRLG